MYLVEKLKLAHVAPGDIFRQAIANNTELGRKVQALIDDGQLAPDELVSETVFKHINTLSTGYLFDGYPRTITQAHHLTGYGTPIDRIFSLEVPHSYVIARLTARRQCPTCKEIYNLVQKPPHIPDTCNTCGVELIQREDDTP